MKFILSLKHPRLVGTVEIVTDKDLIIGDATFSINSHDGIVNAEKEYFWLSSAEMERDLREDYEIFTGKDVTIELHLEKPMEIEMTDKERQVMIALCDFIRSKECVSENR